MGYTTTFTSPEPSRAEIDTTKGPLVLEFGTDWCGFCRAAQPLIEAVFASRPDVPHVKVEDGSGRRLGRSFGVKLWPTLVFLQDGREVAKLVRPSSEAAISDAVARLSAAQGGG